MSLHDAIRGILTTQYPAAYEAIKKSDFFLNRVLALSFAQNDLQLLQIALEAGADPNFLAAHKIPPKPMKAAIIADTEEIATALLKYGLDRDVAFAGGLIHLAFDLDCKWAIRLISEFGGDLDFKNNEGRTVLHEAMFHLDDGGMRETAEFLISLGADIECPCGVDNSYSPIEIAVVDNYIDTVEFILKHGDDVNQLRSRLDGMTLLMAAARWGNAEVCELLLKYGADPAIETSKRKNALWYACRPNRFRGSGITATISKNEPSKRKCQRVLQRALADERYWNGDVF